MAAGGVLSEIMREQKPHCPGAPKMLQSAKPTCPNCRKPLRLLLMKAMPGRHYQCIDCEGEDPLRSADVSRLLQNMRPPE